MLLDLTVSLKKARLLLMVKSQRCYFVIKYIENERESTLLLYVNWGGRYKMKYEKLYKIRNKKNM